MGILSGLIGGFAQGGLDIANNEVKAQQRRAEADYQSELEIKRQTVIQQLREKADQAKASRTRLQDVSDAKTIQENADNNPKRISAIKNIVQSDTGLKFTDEEIKQIAADPDWVNNYGARRDTANGQPAEWDDKGGLINQTTSVTPSTDRARAQELNDKADAAMGIGRMDMEKGFRDQGNLERQVAGDEAKGKRMEAQTAAQAAETARKEKEGEARAEYQSRLAGVAEARAAAAERRANGSDGSLSKEERLKYTSLFSESGRRMSDTQKSISTLTKNLSGLMKENYGQPDTSEITDARQQIESLRGDYNAYKDERSTYQALLAGTDGKESAAKPDPAPKPKPEADKFVPGKKYKDAKGNVATYMGNGKWN